MLRAICLLLFFTEVSVVVLETRLSVVLFLRVSFVPAIIVVPAEKIYIFMFFGIIQKKSEFFMIDFLFLYPDE
jgi:hypothetical protein